MKRLFTFVVLLVLTCLLGNNALAQQNRTTYTIKTEVKKYIDFTVWSCDGDNPMATIAWEGNSIPSISGVGADGDSLTTTFEEFPISVGSGAQGSSTTSTTIWRGQQVFNSWQSTVSIAASYFTNAQVQVGDIIRANYTNKDTSGGDNNYNPWFKYQDWSDFIALQDAIQQGDGYFQAPINSEALTYLQENGLRFQGRGFTLTSVELIQSRTGDTDAWHLWKSGTHGESYLQKQGQNDDYFYIGNLLTGDVVTIWGDSGNNGGCRVTSGNTNRNNENITFSTDNHNEGQQITMTSDGTLSLYFYARWSGIRKIEIKRELDQTTTFDYDPGYEEYDMYDEFSFERNNNPATHYTVGESTGFTLNGDSAKYVTFVDSKITTNNRFALTGNANEWQFDFGLVPPGTNGDYSFLSICNLREGDRVVISYINDENENPLIFASGYDEGGNLYYDGCAAFKDDSRDGILNEGEESISSGYAAPVDWHRNEGYVAMQDNGWGTNYTPELCYINSYVITEDGHLDLAFRRFVQSDPKIVSRIVKVKIFSDHQAMMVDEYDDTSYRSYFNITGELQAKEHIMPGGLEIQVGNNDALQHALVVSSKDGPVSHVNAVDGFKIPGVSKDGDQVSINFDLGLNKDFSKLPTSGTFYKFIPEVKGKMKFKFEAKSMNYYRWDLKGNDVYYNTDLQNSEGEYGDWSALSDRPNEQTVDDDCPYYLVTVKDNRIEKVQLLDNITNGDDYETPEYINVDPDKEYYLYGAWNADTLYFNSSWTTPAINYVDTNQQYNNVEYRPFDGRTIGCGVAQLLWVEFNPEKKIYPLAKWVPNGTQEVSDGNGVPNPDYPLVDSLYEYELADLYGYNNRTHITVKKMAGNISSCVPYLQKQTHEPGQPEHYKLMIRDITFKENKDKGGTILIKIGDPNKRNDPVYTLTVAYSGDPQFDGNSGTDTRGHIWDYSTNSLNGLEWVNPPEAGKSGDTFTNDDQTKYAQTDDYGHYFEDYFGEDISGYSSADEVFTSLQPSSSGKLHEEISAGTSDWMFNYNLVNDGKLYDPLFTNKYDLEADNADLIWETEGTVMLTSANQSVMFNEFTGNIETTTKDPDRYVGVLKGGEFRIPWLYPKDRVLIWMGTGKGAFNDHAVLKIRNAFDALYNEIDPEDEYIVGGSQWNGDEKEYKGCYHFFAKGDGEGGPADMVFDMITGSMVKIYKIQIYRGDHINTNDVVGKSENDKFLLVSTGADPNDNSSVGVIGDSCYWTLQYFGKEQKLADGTNDVNNDIIAQTGHITKELTTVTDEESDNFNSFTYPHDFGEIGTIRVRAKDMEKNMKYVADYADHNVTIAYQETMQYPYTWDFKDMKLYNNDSFIAEDTIVVSSMPAWLDSNNEVDKEHWNASYDKSAQDLSLWVASTQREGAHVLRLNSQKDQDTANLKEEDNIFQTGASSFDNTYFGNQLWANGEVVPETQGLWFFTPDNNQNNGQWYISDQGMELDGNSDWSHKLVVPNVPKNAAVYLRMVTTKTPYFSEQFLKANDNCQVYGPILAPDKSNEYIFAILNKGSKQNLQLSLAGYRLLKLAVSEDLKKLNKYGWATESRNQIIDPELTPFLTGAPIKTFIVTNTSYDLKKRKVLLTEVDGASCVMPAATDDGVREACILYNNNATGSTETNVDFNVNILNGGFHLFVPDMHDYDIYHRLADDQDEVKELQGMEASFMKAQLYPKDSEHPIPMYEEIGGVSYTNYVLTYSTARAGWEAGSDNYPDSDNDDIGKVGFYRVQPKGVTSIGNQGYIQFPTTSVKPNSDSTNYFEIIFEGEIDNDDLDSISNESVVTSSDEPYYYNLWGQKFNGQPTQPGIYIVNGKKVTVK